MPSVFDSIVYFQWQICILRAWYHQLFIEMGPGFKIVQHRWVFICKLRGGFVSLHLTVFSTIMMIMPNITLKCFLITLHVFCVLVTYMQRTSSIETWSQIVSFTNNFWILLPFISVLRWLKWRGIAAPAASIEKVYFGAHPDKWI